jgi:hypothetical protein
VTERFVGTAVGAPTIPRARGPWSRRAISLISGERPGPAGAVPCQDPLGDDDFHLALYLCYELHYGGLPGVPDEREWDPAVLAFRREIEAMFVTGLEGATPRREVEPSLVPDLLRAAEGEPVVPPVAGFLEREATLAQASEFLIHRSAYQLKEADPHTWVIPRLTGPPKTGVVEIQYDEYGSGDPSWMHAELYRATMRSAGLDDRTGAYLDVIPGQTLATVNLISLFGLHRRWRGALVGHLAAFEASSSIPNRAYATGFRRLGMDDEGIRFFDEHVEADAVHEVLAADVAAGLARREPTLAGDIVWGAETLGVLEERWSSTILEAWRAGRSSLLDHPAARVP